MKMSDRVEKCPPSGIREMFELANNYKEVVNLCIGEPGFETPVHIRNAAYEALNAGYTKYTSNAGMIELRNAISMKLKSENGIDVDPNKNIIVTTGAGEAILLTLLALVNLGDEVIVSDPCWPNYLGHIGVAGGKVVRASTDAQTGFRLTAEDVEKVITDKTKVLIVNSPANPTGAVIDDEELLKIGRLALKYDFTIISDEPYEKLIYDGLQHKSLASIDEVSENVITINSFSKSYAMTGWRVGYAAGGDEAIAAMVKLQENVSSCVNSFAQMGAIAALKGSQDHVQMMASEYRQRRDFLIEEMNNIDCFSCAAPNGAFYAFVDVRKMGVTSLEASRIILDKAHVVTTPGTAFGSNGEGYIRVSFASSMDDIVVAMERLKEKF